MKMGTIASPWRYEAAAGETIRPDNQRRTAILRYASWAAVFPISLVLRLPFDSGPFDQSWDRRDGPIPALAAAVVLTPRRGIVTYLHLVVGFGPCRWISRGIAS
jgi:hypothetical protein